jgi:uncharacterized protein (DUF952 family)
MKELFAYKIMTADQWAQLKADGIFNGAAMDLADGYIHLSTRERTAEDVAKHFAGQDRLILAMVDLSIFGDAVKWQASSCGALSPRLYAPITINSVTTKAALRLGDSGTHVFPAGFGS